MSKFFVIFLALGMVATVFGRVLFSAQDNGDRDVRELTRTILRQWSLEKYHPADFYNKRGTEYNSRLSTFSWSNCGEAADPMDITSFTLTPDPIKLPGSMQFSVIGSFKDFLSSPIKLAVTMKKKVGVDWVTIPCVDGEGTCTYDDVCALLPNLDYCPTAVTAAGFNCTCPFPKKAINIPTATYNISGGWGIPAGDYMLQGDFTRTAGHVGCYQLYLSFAH